MIKYIFLSCAFILLNNKVVPQSALLPIDHPANKLAERLEMKTGQLSTIYQSTIYPIARQEITKMASFADTAGLMLKSSDRMDIYYIFKDNYEWEEKGELPSKRKLFKYFYKYPADFYKVRTADFMLKVNPVLEWAVGKQLNNENMLLVNSRGIEVRGDIAKKIGFYTVIMDNQIVVPNFVPQHNALPYEGRFAGYKPFYADQQIGFDFFRARGHISFSPIEQIQISLGHDKQFIGDGLRSMVLSDYSNTMPFLRVQTKVWKLQYTNLWLQPTVQFNTLADTSLDKKMMTIHHLGINITKRLNIGLFESVIAHRKNGGIELGYLNPIIFYRWVEHNLGSPDNVALGLTGKYLLRKNALFYGQFIMDEFSWEGITARNGDWRVKYGFQLGAKYIDAFGISHFDLQVEYNQARPYTYAHFNTNVNYSNYNLPLAHPLGANFQEAILDITYKPHAKWMINARLLYQAKGYDTVGYENAGGDIFQSSQSIYSPTENQLLQGYKISLMNSHLVISYLLKHNLNLYLDYYYMKQMESTFDNHCIMAGMRLNLYRKSWYY